MKTRIKGIVLVMTALVMTMMLGMLVSAEVVAPGKITGIKQIEAGKSSVKISWDAQIDCRYKVELSTDGVNWIETEDTSLTSESEYGLATGATYYARVKGYRQEWVSKGYTYYYGEYSDTIQVVTAPDEVTNITQTDATIDTASFTWTGVFGATYYSVYKEVNGIEAFVGKTTSTSINITGLSRVDFNIIVKAAKASSAGFTVEGNSKKLYSHNINLIPSKPGNIYVSNYWGSLKEIQAKWDQSMFADGYQVEVYRANDKKPMSTLQTSFESVYAKNINEKNFYKIRVRAYTTINGQIKYGQWSDYVHLAQQPKVKLKKVGSKKLKVSWNKVNGATSYTVYMSTKKDSGYKKVKTLKKTSLTVKKFKKKALKKNKTYYVYVVANKKVGKKNIKSGVSSTYYLRKF